MVLYECIDKGTVQYTAESMVLDDLLGDYKHPVVWNTLAFCNFI
jgi:hypothetical protein